MGSLRTISLSGGPAPLSFVSKDDYTFEILDSTLQTVSTFRRTSVDAPRVCSGDVDGDGQTEVLVPQENDLTLREIDGTRVWTAQVPRESGYPGANACSVVDLDVDGCLDVVWPQNGLPYVYDAATGQARTAPVGGAATAHLEAQPILDLDLDGDLEIVLAGQNADGAGVPTWSGIRAYTETTGAWIGVAP